MIQMVLFYFPDQNAGMKPEVKKVRSVRSSSGVWSYALSQENVEYFTFKSINLGYLGVGGWGGDPAGLGVQLSSEVSCDRLQKPRQPRSGFTVVKMDRWMET